MNEKTAQSVLVIDDSQDIQLLLRVRLQPEGVEVHGALDGESGIARAKELLPDLILLDVDLAGTSGFDVCTLLKSDPATESIPVIFLTGTSDTEAKVRGFDLGAVDYVTKPFEPSELRARVRAALRTKRYRDLLATRAQVDGLTGLWNRAYFDQRLSELAAARDRYDQPVSLMMIDVDHFKSCNDRFGHPFGDRVLSVVARTLGEELRTTDVLCRYGGEEFAILMPSTLAVGALVLGERLRKAIEELAFEHKNERVTITASFGIASSEHQIVHGDDSCRELLRKADEALYAAKNSGRNRVCVAS